MHSLGTTCTSRSTSVVLPVPDGADTMKSSPRPCAGLLDILHLLAHPFELRLRVDDQLRHIEAIGLGAHRIDLTVHFLKQEIQLPAARLLGRLQGLPVREMRAE